MKYIFEDSKESPLSELFTYTFKKEVFDDIIFTDGNSNIVKYVENALKDYPDEILVVFLDLVPAHSGIWAIYDILSSISIENNYKVIVIPIVCFEYYFIKSVENDGLFYDKESLDICCNKKPFFNAPIIMSESHRRYCTTFERYCKAMFRRRLAMCIRSDEYLPNNSRQDYYNNYFYVDCNSSEGFYFCKEKPLIEKSERYLKEFPCIPEGSSIDTMVEISNDEVWVLHRRLVDEFNEWVDILKEAELDNSKKVLYRYIRYIKEGE